MTAVSVETNEFLSRRFLIRSSSGDAEIFRVIRFGPVLEIPDELQLQLCIKVSSWPLLLDCAASSVFINMSGRKETVLDLAKFVDRGVSVKLSGGRQVTGILKGYDQLLNLVLDEATENLRDSDDPMKTTDQIRQLGLIVCRGTAVMLVAPTDGTEEIPNPFLQNETPAAT
ncbi:sm-like protein LSM7 isoform X1 [Physcomitrium patens]|uniref:Sm domain-containing protein n=1 Tax=Physcomitrium patens TaxID=3218 RepID=A0A2K1KMT9_PHYPA|nr:sm-like protein LSM7 isoform X1 [Physcomitrium patens]XP_024372935.1 sm-like protein LSM7 isoform X1 [Physcomitrium patens]XP_024372936.1 sm-like protein LSM7 isoform X1 [Physcomitrium patens]XP_024372938.1 sm-like protein LSM7 isoform X1 [Physcomitrium patens]PNR55092.1 hypothetical protein PHYPA_005985 [Physcomitrium patens]|eukprot:XP_024372934.1 sm-like protein LSM7 isoform X1 [Physcomitrella patens]